MNETRATADRSPLPDLRQPAAPESAADPALTASVAPFLAAEARLLDGRAFEEWAALFTGDGLLVVPLRPGGTPARELTLTIDDAARRSDRVAWLAGETTWSHRPAPRTCRLVGTVEAWPTGNGGGALVRSVVLLTVDRESGSSTTTGEQWHRLVPARPWAIEAKWFTPLGTRHGLVDPSVIL